jgi:hypothetical protein
LGPIQKEVVSVLSTHLLPIPPHADGWRPRRKVHGQSAGRDLPATQVNSLFVGFPVLLDNANPGQDLFLNVLIHNLLQNHSCPNPVKMPTLGRNVFYKALTINTLRVSQMPDTPPVGYKIASSMEGLKNND